MKIGRVVNNSKAILDYNDHGFNFGWSSLSMIGQNLHVNNWNNYEKIVNVDTTHIIEEIETFTIAN